MPRLAENFEQVRPRELKNKPWGQGVDAGRQRGGESVRQCLTDWPGRVGDISWLAGCSSNPPRHLGGYFFNPTLLARLAILRLVSTFVTVPVLRYFCFTVSRMASRWS
jgi:hypothetical protein